MGGCAARGTVKAGVEVNGVPVGGMEFSAAAEAVREKLRGDLLPLTVRAPDGDLRAQLGFSDNVEEILKGAQRKGNYTAEVRRQWVTMERDLAALCARNAREGVNAEMTFSKEGFSYMPGSNAVVCDYDALLRAVCETLDAGGTEVDLPLYERAPEVTEETLRERTRLLSSCATQFDASNAPRTHNIALAAERIAGTVIGAGETFSFNEVVGKRTLESGFEEATVIFEGEFVRGVGGGVCQVSTTLFGAALRAGLDIEESRPHSLTVSYVEPSQDAMVSEYSDLKIANPYPYPVYLLATADMGTVSIFIYGMPDGRRYEVESRVLFTLDPPPARIVEGTQNRTVRAERKGMASESWLLCYEGDRLLSRTLIRRDTYACVQGIEERVPLPPTAEEILEGEL